MDAYSYISLKDVICSENILKIRSLVKEGFEITSIKSTDGELHGRDLQNLCSSVRSMINDKHICLSEASKQISDHIAGCIAHQTRKLCEGCCDEKLCIHDQDESCTSYHKNLSRGGLIVASKGLRECVAQGFAYLDASSDIISQSSLPARRVMNPFRPSSSIVEIVHAICEKHEGIIFRRVVRTVTNFFFNNLRKRKNESEVKYCVAAFKKSKREKNGSFGGQIS